MKAGPLPQRRDKEYGFVQLVLMEQLDYTPDPGTEEEGTYPEPDYIPVYPWLGQQDEGGSPPLSAHPIPDSCPMHDEGFGRQTHDNTVGTLEPAIDNEMGRTLFPPSPLRHCDDPAVDPDFELSEGSRMCVSVSRPDFVKLSCESGVKNSCQKRTQILSRSHFRSVLQA